MIVIGRPIQDLLEVLENLIEKVKRGQVQGALINHSEDGVSLDISFETSETLKGRPN